MSDDKVKKLQNLRQEKTVQADKYERARKVGDSVGMRRATKEIERINREILLISKG